MHLRRLSFSASRRFSTTLSRTEALSKLSLTHTESPTPEEIRRAYLSAALKVHPDFNPSLPSSAFIEIVEARDLLLSATLAKVGAGSYRPRPPTAAEEFARYTEYVSEKGADMIREMKRRRAENLRGPRGFNEGERDREEEERQGVTYDESGREITARQSLADQLTAALDRSFHGPKLPFSPAANPLSVWPYAFECEVRNQPQGSQEDLSSAAAVKIDLMEVVVGRTELGSVGCVDPGDLPMLSDCGGAEGIEASLELKYCGEIVAYGVRREVVCDDGYTYEVDIYGKGSDGIFSQIASIEDDGGFRSTFLSKMRSKVGGSGMARRKRNRTKFFDPAGVDTHALSYVRTPGVEHMHLFRKVPTAKGAKAFCELRVVAASVAPASMWLFEPRKETHNKGGFYVEKVGQFSRKHVSKRDFEKEMEVWEGGLDPRVLTMWLGFIALDNENKS